MAVHIDNNTRSEYKIRDGYKKKSVENSFSSFTFLRKVHDTTRHCHRIENFLTRYSRRVD